MPSAGGSRRPAVLEFGGSEGGLHGQLIGAALAAAGYPTLDIAYFGVSGLPPTLAKIPLEYFAHALRWLAAQPEVLKDRIYVLGGSRGSEAAMLLGAHYPARATESSPPHPATSHSGRTRAGVRPRGRFTAKPCPTAQRASTWGWPVNDPAAEIPVQRIRGPVFLDCGTADEIWSSCAYAMRIDSRLNAARFPYPHVLYRYQGAGHHVNTLGAVTSQAMGLPISLSLLPKGTRCSQTPMPTPACGRAFSSFLAHPAGQDGVLTAPSTAPSLIPGSQPGEFAVTPHANDTIRQDTRGAGAVRCDQCEEPRRRARPTRRRRRAVAESAPMIAIVRAAGLRMLAELTSSSLTASTSPRRHAPTNTDRATSSATS